MNSLKSLMFLAVLAAILFGVYVALNRAPQPGGESAGQTGSGGMLPPNVQMPGTGNVAPPFVPGQAAGQSPAPLPSPQGPLPPFGAGGEAPSYRAGDPAPGGQDRLSVPPDAFTRRPPGPAPEAAPARDPAPGGAAPQLMTVIGEVEAKLKEKNLAEAHRLLSTLYNDPQVPPEQARQITRLLDQLAATVVYSREHQMEAPYRVRSGDTLEAIAKLYDVPPQLLARINGIRDPQNLAPGRELKVVRGPFNAVIDLRMRELTLFVRGCYAARFPVDLGDDALRMEGSYQVRDKRIVSDPAAAAALPGPPRLCIDLGNQVSIETVDSRSRTPGAAPLGAAPPPSIGLGPQDMDDVFGILSVGSRVVIQR